MILYYFCLQLLCNKITNIRKFQSRMSHGVPTWRLSGSEHIVAINMDVRENATKALQAWPDSLEKPK